MMDEYQYVRCPKCQAAVLCTDGDLSCHSCSHKLTGSCPLIDEEIELIRYKLNQERQYEIDCTDRLWEREISE